MKQELGISFKDFLTRIRISQAVRLMEDRELSINQIAEKVGYSNQHYFSAAFKNCQGCRPQNSVKICCRLTETDYNYEENMESMDSDTGCGSNSLTYDQYTV